jgi:hypothetical protein
MACMNRKYHHTRTKYKYEHRRRRFLSLASALVLRFGTVPKLVENMSRVLEDHDRHLIGLGY